ncbi:NAD(P)-dependent oxidoreductase [Paenibacillus puldeungensis]|uniref:NAD(P)-dependent oxidoreductase n=2 Tax=Paenibacillus puldeungensis TaxID=696536 RepID=A0ABW3RSK8_9BACL
MPSHEYEIQVLKKGFPEAEICVYEYTDEKRSEFLDKISDATALLTAFIKIDKDVLDHARNLQVISINATGYDNVDLVEATKHSVGVCPVGEYCTDDVAEHTIALMLALNKNLKSYTYDIEKNNQWKYDTPQAPVRIGNQTLGIFGLGKIGKRVAKLAQGLGMTVIATDPLVTKETAAQLGIQMVEPGDIFEGADVISNHMNLGSSNIEYFTEKEFNKMKRTPIFLNLGRGLSINEQDLADALDRKLVRAAGLDVLKDETAKLKNHILANRDNVIITPHAAFYSSQSMTEMQRISCENIVHFLSGNKEKVFKLVNEV